MENLSVSRYDAIVVGTGCAGYQAADCLAAQGVCQIAILTEGVRMGTSRNTGSDKQTYYKLALGGAASDSVRAMAEDLFAGGGMNGDTALIEASYSARCFSRLLELGVPFPCNEYGEYIGYRTDHDTRARATSCGPLTSRYMTEALERSCAAKGICVRDHMQVTALLRDADGMVGVLALDTRTGAPHAVLAPHVVLATGGPAGVYARSVYPKSQTGASGMALAAGARFANLQEWQYGMASVQFRWNVSGSYQQVLPRYFSVDAAGREHAFLNDALAPDELLRLTFRKGYEWPVDARKLDGSSKLDLLVYDEIVRRGRRVFLDFRRNPVGLCAELSNFPEEARAYCAACDALLPLPIDRLAAMNPAAITLYHRHQIDLHTEPLEISVCAQHCNGGLDVDANWQTSIPGLYAAGEAAGTFGAYRPGGTALNSAQVGGMRAAEHIAAHPRALSGQAAALRCAQAEWDALRRMVQDGAPVTRATLLDERRALQPEMSDFAAFLRETEQFERMMEERRAFLQTPRRVPQPLWGYALRTRDIAQTQLAMLSAMQQAAAAFGSRGGAMFRRGGAQLAPRADAANDQVITEQSGGELHSSLRAVRPIPNTAESFEAMWRAFRARRGAQE